jgi:hypothetical protein
LLAGCKTLTNSTQVAALFLRVELVTE